MSKFLNEDLGGMRKISERDPNMNMKSGVLITDGSMKILTLKSALLGMAAPWRCQEHHRPSAQPCGPIRWKTYNQIEHLKNTHCKL